MSSSEPSLNPSTENLLNIDDIDAFKLAFEMSDLTLQQIAAEMGLEQRPGPPHIFDRQVFSLLP